MTIDEAKASWASLIPVPEESLREPRSCGLPPVIISPFTSKRISLDNLNTILITHPVASPYPVFIDFPTERNPQVCVNRKRQWHPTPVLLPGKSHGRRSLVGCSPWGRKESDTTERLPFHFSLSCIGEGNGNPLQCPCLENPRDGGAWWAAVYGVTQSRTRLRRLSRSSSCVNTYISYLIPGYF